MDIVAPVKNTIMKYSMLSTGDRVLVGLSGGPDSVCLLAVLHRLRHHFGITLSALYVDHGLRPDETPDEIAFCKRLCLSLDVPFSAKAVDVNSFAKAHRLSKQEAARELRYDALAGAAEAVGAHKIALGHTADDQAETVIMRLVRGAGALGLSGIPPIRQNIIRPLIGTERKEIERFLETGQIGFITDSSNHEDKYMRNKIRQTVMPALKKLGAGAVMTISRTADILREEDNYLEFQVTKSLMKLIGRKTDTTLELLYLPLEKTDSALVRRILRRSLGAAKGLRGIAFIHIEELTDLIKKGKPGDRISMPGGIRAIKGYSTLVITSDRPVALETYVLEGPGALVIKEASMVLVCSPFDTRNDTSLCPPLERGAKALFDAAKLRFPLHVRSRKPGDYFYPAGFGKKKKLQDYFVDEKVPRDQRDCIPLLISGNDIVWIIGYRTDERYRIDKCTGKGLQFELRPLKT